LIKQSFLIFGLKELQLEKDIVKTSSRDMESPDTNTHILQKLLSSGLCFALSWL